MMKKIFTLCLLGTLAMTATSCDDKKEDSGSASITVNGRTERVKSAFYLESPLSASDEAGVEIALLNESYKTLPSSEPEFYVSIGISESLLGKTIDLTKPVDATAEPAPWITIAAKNGDQWIEIDNDQYGITVEGDATVTSGALSLTRSGDNFTVKMSVTLSDGTSASAQWQGTAKSAKSE